jgi:hypothetical protein
MMAAKEDKMYDPTREIWGLLVVVLLVAGCWWLVAISDYPDTPPSLPSLEYRPVPPVSNPSIVVNSVFYCAASSVSYMKISIANSSGDPLSILWDESSMILPNGVSKRIIHTGIRYLREMEQQIPTVIPPYAEVVEAIWPTENIVWSNTYNKWIETKIFVAPGDKISLYLVWESPEGKHWYQWSWVFQTASSP